MLGIMAAREVLNRCLNIHCLNSEDLRMFWEVLAAGKDVMGFSCLMPCGWQRTVRRRRYRQRAAL